MPFHDYLYYSVKDRRSIVLIAVIAVVGAYNIYLIGKIFNGVLNK